jgi:RNA polymerase sigma-70 factor (ECF subfamily)
MIDPTHKKTGNHFAGDLVRMQEQLFYYALRLTEDRQDAMDLVQETSYKALKNRNRLQHTGHIRAWLYTILKNTYINYLRSSQFRQLVYDSDGLAQVADQNGEVGDSAPDEQLVRKEMQEIIGMLPGAYGGPLKLLLSGFSYKEIADRMKLPIGTVKSRIHLGKKKIRKVYTA